MARQFKIMDYDESGELDLNEFIKAVKDFKAPIDEQDIRIVFDIFDRNNNGRIHYDEFVRSLKGKMNSFRIGLVDLAFRKLDKDGSGRVDIYDLKGVYSAKDHPDVRSGKKTEDQALSEYLETFEMHKNLAGGKNDSVVTKEEFREYYNNISATIDDDKMFETMIVNTWKLQGEDSKKPSWTQAYEKSKPVGASHGAPFGTTEEPTDYSTALRPKEEKKSPVGKSVSKGHTYSDRQLIGCFKQMLIARGTRGILSLSRAFRIIDDDNSKSLSLAEFKKVIKEYRLKYSELDCERLFKLFDRDGSGSIDFDEFLRAIVVNFIEYK